MSSSSALSESQLAAFRQKAGPILAEARGLTPGALAKLGDIARDLGLADDQVQDAIRALHGGTVKAKDPAAEKFRSRLMKDLAVKKTIIGPEIEARIVAGGVQKYALSEAVILEVLSEVAAELGLRRITGNEAIAHFVEMVDSAIGDKTWLNRQAWDRLRMASEKWGLTFEDADQLVEQKLDANRRASFRGKLMGWVVTYGSFGVVACVLLTIGFLISRRKNDSETTGTEGTTIASPGGGEESPPAVKGPPDWWGYELAIAATEARREVPGFARVYDLLMSPAPDQRSAGYGELVTLGAKLTSETRPRAMIEEIIASCHAREPDDNAAEELRTALLALIPAHSTPEAVDANLYERAFWSVGVCRQLLHAKVVRPDRPSAMAAALSSSLGVSVMPEEKEEEQAAKIETALSGLLFQNLLAITPHHPATAPALYRFLQEHGRLPTAPEEREPLEASYLAALLPVSVTNWREHQELLTKLVRSKNPLVTLRMADLLTKVSDRGLQSLLAEELVRQTGAKPPKTSDPKDAARAVRAALGAAGVSSAQSQEDRWDLLRLEAGPSLTAKPPPAPNHAELLQETVVLARLATLAAALSQGESGFPVFDELEIPKKPPESGEKDAFAESPKPASARVKPLSNREKQQLEQMIATLRAYREHPPVARANSLRTMAQIAPAVPDLTYDQATAVAHYLLAEKADAEQQGIQSLMPHFQGWRQLRLALADQVEGTRLSAGQVQSLVDGLCGESVNSGSDSFRRTLLLSVKRDLGTAKSSSGESSATQQAAEQLAEYYRTRARLAGVSSPELNGAESPGEVLELLVRFLAKGSGDKKPVAGEAGLAEQLEAARFLGTGDLRKTVLLQRLVIRAAVQRLTATRPRQAESAALILADLETADAKAENLLIQLYHGEAATLKLGMLYGTN